MRKLAASLRSGLFLLAIVQFAASTDAKAQRADLDDVAFCKLLTAEEIAIVTHLTVIKTESGNLSCSWELAAEAAGERGGNLRARARREEDSPTLYEIGLEGIGLQFGVYLTPAPYGAAALVLGRLDGGPMGVHAVCSYYLFSLEFDIPGIDYRSVGLTLGGKALRRINGPQERCFASKLLDKYPD